MGKSVVEVLREKFQGEADSYTDRIRSGSPKDWGEYRQAVGFIRGVDRCLAIVDTLEKTMMESDFDD